jgi:hypothetical protein
MNIYEFITPSDPITFKTNDDKIAFICALFLGNGKAGCKRFDDSGNEISIPTMLMFSKDPDSEIKNYIGGNASEYFDSKKHLIKAAFESFSYGNIEDRRSYDDAIIAITDTNKLKNFKAKHEDRNRSSLSKWVKSAWKLAEGIN